jgi:hypothetical protein
MKPKVFLLVTIPTHLRVLMETADLLSASGRYEPVMLYHPSAVFDHNHALCQQAPHDAFLWTGRHFVSKAQYLAGSTPADSLTPGVPQGRGLSRWLPNRGLYTRWSKAIPILPTPEKLIYRLYRVIGAVTAIVRFFAGAYAIAMAVVISLMRPFTAGRQEQGRSRHSWLQRLLLRNFAHAWDAQPTDQPQGRASMLRRIGHLLGDGLFGGLNEQKTFDEAIRALISAERPALIVLPEANLFYNSQLVVRAAHLQGVPSVIVPFTIVNTLEWAEAFYDVPSYQVSHGWNRLFAKAFPHWVLAHKGRRLILPPVYILSCEYLGMVPKVPWLINSGNADVIAAESQFMADYYRRAGIDPDKIRFTGALSDDKLFAIVSQRAAHRQALGQRHGLVVQDKVVLLGLPPDQFAAGKRPGCEFDTFEDLLRFMVGTAVDASGGQATVLINLHPRIKRANLPWLAELGAAIIDAPIEDLVPLADVYVAVASATIRLGISCGIPVVNYDAYQYDYDDYKGLAGVCEVRTRHDYNAVLHRLIGEPAYYLHVQTAQRATASELCLVDGRAGERMLGLFDELTGGPAGAGHEEGRTSSQPRATH